MQVGGFLSDSPLSHGASLPVCTGTAQTNLPGRILLIQEHIAFQVGCRSPHADQHRSVIGQEFVWLQVGVPAAGVSL